MIALSQLNLPLAEFLLGLGYTNADTLFVKAFGPKGTPDDVRLNHGLSFLPQGAKRPIQIGISGAINLSTGIFTWKSGRRQGQVETNGWDFLQSLNDRYYGIYFVVNQGGTFNAEINQSRNLFYEIDNLSFDEQRSILSRLEQTFSNLASVVQTYKSLHCYWNLTVNKDLTQVKQFQERLIQMIGKDIADNSIADPAQVMRLPGFKYWLWNSDTQQIEHPCDVTIDQLNSQVLSWDLFDRVLPTWDKSLWIKKPVRPSRPPAPLGAEYGDMRDIGPYLDAFNANGRQGNWATAKCPNQGSGHSNNPSNNSLHINMATGQFTCHAGCSHADVHRAAKQLAVTRGYYTWEQWEQQVLAFRKQPKAIALPPDDAPAPPETDELPPISNFGDGESDLYVLPLVNNQDSPDPTDPKPVVMSPMATGTFVFDKVKSDGRDNSLWNSAIRARSTSDVGDMILNEYCWVQSLDAWIHLGTQRQLSDKQLTLAHDTQNYFSDGNNYIQIPQAEKAKKITVTQFLLAHGRKASALGYAPGQGAFIETKASEFFPRVNLWREPPTGLPASETDVAPWLEHVTRLFGESKAQFLVWYFAHCLRQPDVQAEYMPVLLSIQQKTGRELMLRPIYWAFDQVRQAVKIECTSYQAQYNSIMKGKRFIVVNELKRPTSAKDRWDDPNDWLKNMIGQGTTATRQFNGKYARPEEFPFYGNFIGLTNEPDSIRIADDVSRYVICESDLQADRDYYQRIIDFYDDDGYAKVIGYLQTVDLNQFDPGIFPEQFREDQEHMEEASEGNLEYVIQQWLDSLESTIAQRSELTSILDAARVHASHGDITSALMVKGWKSRKYCLRSGDSRRSYSLVYHKSRIWEEVKAWAKKHID
jgi:hypothetical protein